MNVRLLVSSVIGRSVGRLRRWQATRGLRGPKLLRAFARERPDAFFVQVGSNDGRQLDPLRATVLRTRWKGLMVEPVPYVFARLERNCAGLRDKVKLANLAVGAQDGALPFYHLAEAGESDRTRLPFWYDQLGSFRKDVVLRHAEVIPDIEQRLVTVMVRSVTFDTLFREFGVARVDLLHTDTEGYDFALLQSFDFRKYAPAIVIYEHFHFTPDERRNCAQLLSDNGYDTVEEGMDTWCLSAAASPALWRLWRALKKRGAPQVLSRPE